MDALAAPALALIRQAEGWSVGNVLGALVLGTVLFALVGFGLFVILRR